LTVDADDEYRRELAKAKAKTGFDESVMTGEGRVFGRRVAVVACEFDFLAGSIGVGRRGADYLGRRARDGRTPCRWWRRRVSGGTRMQEGTVAFLQMVKIAAAVELHKQAHLP